VITAAAPGQRSLPLQRLVDRDGVEKSLLQILVAEVLRANIEEICVVVRPGDETAYAQWAGGHRLAFVEQREPLGYANAVLCARDFTGNEPFLHLVGDHLYVSNGVSNCAQELVDLAAAEGCAVSAVQATREGLLPQYGAVAGKRIAGRPGLYRIETVIEKPTPTEAEERLMVSGLRAGYYLCFFGMHVLTPAVMNILADLPAPSPVSPALAELARREQYLAMECASRRYDVGTRYGILTAQMALALSGKDREEVLSRMLELLAQREAGSTGQVQA